MIVTLQTETARHPARVPFAGADHALVDAACPICKTPAPLKVRGVSPSHDHDTWSADAMAVCCGARIGQLQAKVSTIFGIDEDRAVLNGRPRVY